jgi:hypothetical protein
MRVQVGDVIRWSRAWSRDFSPPLWSLIISHDGDDDFTDVTLLSSGGVKAGSEDKINGSKFPNFGKHAVAEIVPADELPDEVLVALAKYQLTGEIK